MKRIILILSILLIASPCFARMGLMQLCGAVPSVAACSTEMVEGNSVAANTVLGNGTIVGVAGSWTADSNFSLCKIILNLRKVSSPTFTITIELWSDSTGPSTKICDIGTQSSAALTTSAAEYTYTLPVAQAVTSGTKYWIVMFDGAGGDGSNAIQVMRSGSGGGGFYKTTDDTNWTADDSDAQIYLKVYR